ncbi:MAG: nucleotidyl transferase AbiEii/AbiGii toxin family protein [Chitinispirillaceae bacterium]|nr:nucleotidyl transferase AbiEii/AbiGii toxin family protein [Chitinispirillaceae bacterium]
MTTEPLSPLQVREIFHLEFLRRLVRETKPLTIALKGGSNIRFYFDSPRYSEDMDLDCVNLPVVRLQDIVIKILSMKTFLDSLSVYGINRIKIPDMRVSKQTETTQWFKIHLMTRNGLDLFTKIEFSRRGFSDIPVVQTIASTVLQNWRIAPFMAPHYPARSALIQKITALAQRSAVQARDIFDIYILRPHVTDDLPPIAVDMADKARRNIFAIDYQRFSDTVAGYLAPDDHAQYGTHAAFEEMQLVIDQYLARVEKKDA